MVVRARSQLGRALRVPKEAPMGKDWDLVDWLDLALPSPRPDAAVSCEDCSDPPGSRDRRGAEVLPRSVCLRLLAQEDLGRLAVVVHGVPIVLPVNYALLGEDVVVRTGTGLKLRAAVDRALVAFEVDRVDRETGVATSVLVRGPARVVGHPSLLGWASESGPQPLVPEPGGHLVLVESRVVTGRRFRIARAPRSRLDEPATAAST
jgi:hypothetical protein